MSKKISILILLVITLLCTSTVFGVNFTDMDGHWAKNVVNEMANKGILNGFEDGTFRPNESVTREQFAKILVESLKLEKKDSTIKFQDVEDSRWSKEYIETASKYLTGYEMNGKYYFRPTESCVREDVAVAVVMAEGLQNETPNYNLIDKFSDEDKISDSLRKYIAIAVEHEIMIGKGGYFDPQGALTRAEVSQLLYNVSIKVPIGEIEEEEKIVYGDANNDGKVNNKDVTCILKYLENIDVKINLKNADANADGTVDDRDVVVLLGYTSDAIDSLPHTCVNFTEKYEKIDEKNHKLIKTCECKKTWMEQTKEHVFENGKCICGAEQKVEEKIIYGDVNYDGIVDAKDLVRLRNYVDGKTKDISIKNSDVNNDTKINEDDIYILQSYIAGAIKSLPHTCIKYKTEMINVPDIGHKISNICECGKEISYIMERHMFIDGKCKCGAEQKIEEEKIVYGDLNGDGEVDVLDLTKMRLYLENNNEEIKTKNADLNKDGKIDGNDLEILRKYLAGTIKELPHVCKKHSQEITNVPDIGHKISNICECGKEISYIMERHMFIDGKCKCGAEEKVEETILYGDVNADGKINNKDILAISKFLADSTYNVNMKNADVNVDGKVNYIDRYILLRRSVGDTEFSNLPYTGSKFKDGILKDQIEVGVVSSVTTKNGRTYIKIGNSESLPLSNETVIKPVKGEYVAYFNYFKNDELTILVEKVINEKTFEDADIVIAKKGRNFEYLTRHDEGLEILGLKEMRNISTLSNFDDYCSVEVSNNGSKVSLNIGRCTISNIDVGDRLIYFENKNDLLILKSERDIIVRYTAIRGIEDEIVDVNIKNGNLEIMAVGEASKVSKVIYQIDDGETQTILDDSATIQVPESFCDGKVHKITVNAFYQDGLGVDDKKIAESVPEVYYFKYVE